MVLYHKIPHSIQLKEREAKFQAAHYRPTHPLDLFVQHYWMIDWDLRGEQSHLSQNLPHPCVHISFEPGQSRIVGVVKGRFSYLLEGKGRVFGVRFKPGAFYPFIKVPVARFTNTSVNLSDIFGSEIEPLETVIFGQNDQTLMVKQVEQFLHRHLPQQDERVEELQHIIDRIITDQAIMQVEDIVFWSGIGKRTLQRLFNDYVGVSPKWLIKRYRLHHAAERIINGEVVDWSKLALDLGYFDQAHFIKDFKTVVGATPAEYTRTSYKDPHFSETCTMLTLPAREEN